MARGIWQGSGTWQTNSGPDLSGLIGVAVLVGVAAAAMAFVLEFIWYIAIFLAAVVTGAVVGAVLFRRRIRHHAAELEAGRPARLAAEAARRQVPAAPPLVIAPVVYNLNFYGMPADERGAVIRAVKVIDEP
jgi:hypothetical protein